MSDEQDPPAVTPWAELGWPKPANNPITKPQMRAAYTQHQLPRMKELWTAEADKAIGVKHLVARDAEGKFLRVTDMPIEELDALLAAGGTRFEVHMRDPDVNAIKGILDRCMDKPGEQEQTLIVKDGNLVEKLDRAKERARKGKVTP